MTKLTAGKTIVRETAVLERGDPLVVELGPRRLVLRVKGKRTESYTVDYEILAAWLRKREWQQQRGGRA